MSMTFRRLRLPALITVAAVGYREITTTKTVEVRYTGPRQWWDASWAEAPRLAWRTIPEHARPATAATRSRFWRACGKTTAACCATSRWVTRRPAARTEPRREPRRAGTGRRTVRPRRYRRAGRRIRTRDRKSTRLNSSHVEISYAVFCLKKKKKEKTAIKMMTKNHIK